MMRPIRWLSLAFSLLAVSVGLSCTPKTPTYTLHYTEQRARLPNGLRMVILPDSSTPMVHVAVRYEVGANEDPDGKHGLAHLVEHMMFQHRFLGPDGPPTFDIIRQISTFYNANTGNDRTHYFLEGRAEQLDEFLRLEAARMGAGCNTIPPEQFEREREVVRNEIRGHIGKPEGRIYQLLLKTAYPEGHAYSHDPGGDDKEISNIKFEDVCKFMKDYYTPDRATVVVVGNVNPEDVYRKIKYAFGGIARRSPAPRKEVAPLASFKHKEVDVNIDVERSELLVMWRLPPINSPDWPAAQTMMATVAQQVRWFNRDWDFASNVSSGMIGGPLAPILLLQLELYDSKDKGEALDYVWKATKLIHRNFEEGSFNDEAKARAKADVIESVESLSARANEVADLVQFEKNVDFNSPDVYFIHELDQLDKLDGGKFRKFMKGTLSKDNSVVLFVKSDKKGMRGDKRSGLKFSASTEHKPQAPLVDPAEAKTTLPVPEISSVLSTAERYTLGNGMRIVLLPYKAMPIVTSMLMFDAGSAVESPDRAGLAQVAARFLEPPRGATFWKVGVGFGANARDDYTVFYAHGMEIYLRVAIEGLERIIRAGEQEQTQIERWQKVVRDRFKSGEYRRNQEFSRLLYSAVFGPEHPYTTNGDPTEKSVGRIGRDAAMDFKRKHYSAKNATLIVVGSFDPENAKGIIKGTFGEWGGGHKDEPVSPTARPRTGPEYFAVVEPEKSPQMEIQVAYPAPAGIDADQAARSVLVEMLSNRLMDLRFKLGVTYGTHVQSMVKVGPSAYWMEGAVDGTRAGEALTAFRDKIDSLRRGDDFDAEFARARHVVMNNLLAESTDSFSLAQRLAQIAIFRLPPDYFDQEVKAVAHVTPEMVKALIAKDLKPEYEVLGCMADRETLNKAFAEAGIDKVNYVEPKEK